MQSFRALNRQPFGPWSFGPSPAMTPLERLGAFVICSTASERLSPSARQPTGKPASLKPLAEATSMDSKRLYVSPSHIKLSCSAGKIPCSDPSGKESIQKNPLRDRSLSVRWNSFDPHTPGKQVFSNSSWRAIAGRNGACAPTSGAGDRASFPITQSGAYTCMLRAPFLSYVERPRAHRLWSRTRWSPVWSGGPNHAAKESDL